MQVRYLGWEDPLEEGMASQCSILAWRIPWTEEPGELHGVAKEWDMTQQLNKFFSRYALSLGFTGGARGVLPMQDT